jgi:hypothetical protein
MPDAGGIGVTLSVTADQWRLLAIEKELTRFGQFPAK